MCYLNYRLKLDRKRPKCEIMFILLNRNSNNGRAANRWDQIKECLESKYALHASTIVTDPTELNQQLKDGYLSGERLFVAAGGDGTVNLLINALMDLEENQRRQIVFGAIGIGSSNDFHKPHKNENLFKNGIYYRLDSQNATGHNVAEVTFEDQDGNSVTRYFIINSSIGIVACANQLFNSCDKIINWLKKRWVNAAIWYAALRTLFIEPNIPAKFKVNSGEYLTSITNLGILINTHFSGNLKYDLPLSVQAEYLGVALCENMRLRERLAAIISLAKGHFKGRPKTKYWQAENIDIYPDKLTALELDGETCLARNIKIKLIHNALRVCQ
jgi:diacylglycerol kinase (ATP)